MPTGTIVEKLGQNTPPPDGGTKEREILNPTQSFNSVDYTQPLDYRNIGDKEVVSEYGNLTISKIRDFNSLLADGLHWMGAVYVSSSAKNKAHVMAHELGHASHSLLGDKINKDPEVIGEVKSLENVLYPGLREKVKAADSPDNSFFNYLFSSNELIAEFNVLRLKDPKLAAEVAPKLTSLLASVSKDPNLVVTRDTVPGDLGGEVKARGRYTSSENQGIKLRDDSENFEAPVNLGFTTRLANKIKYLRNLSKEDIKKDRVFLIASLENAASEGRLKEYVDALIKFTQLNLEDINDLVSNTPNSEKLSQDLATFTPENLQESSSLETAAETVGKDVPTNTEEELQIIEDLRDDVFDSFDGLSEGLDVDSKNAINRAISNATTATELIEIQESLVAITADTQAKEDSVVDGDGEFSPVNVEKEDTFDTETTLEITTKRFTDNANPEQKEEFYERVGINGEDAQEVATDIANRDGIQNFQTDDELLDGVNDGQSDIDLNQEESPRQARPVKLYGGLFFADTDFWIDTAQNIYQTTKDLKNFTKKMVGVLGKKVIPAVKQFFNDLVRNKGRIKSATKSPKKSPTPAPTNPKTPQQLAQSSRDRQAEGLDTKSVNTNSPILVPAPTTDRSAEIGRQESGLSAIPIIGALINKNLIGDGTTLAGQLSKMLENNFITRAFLEWNQDYSSADQKASLIGDQLRKYAPFLKRDKSGNLLSVKTKQGGPQSLKTSDVIEAMMEDVYAYDAPREFREFVAVWKNIRKELVEYAEANNVNPKFLLDSNGDVDLNRLIEGNKFENLYFPRGRVRVKGGGEEGGKNRTGKLSTAPSQFTRSRKISKENDANDDLEYFDDPIKRIELFAASTYKAIANRRLATNPDLAKQASKRGPKAVKGETLTSSVVNIGGSKFLFNNENAEVLNNLIEGRTASSAKEIQAVSNAANLVRSISFTGDFSALGVQLFYLSARSPIRFAKVATQSIASIFTPKFLNKFVKDNAPILKEMTELGGNYNTVVEDIQFLSDTNASNGFLRKGASLLTKPFTVFHRTATNLGSIEMYKALRHTALESTGKKDPNGNDIKKLNLQKAATLVEFADRTAGRENLAKNGVTSNKREFYSILSSAPSMYVAFTNLMGSTLAANNSFEAKTALLNHGRFLGGAALQFVGMSILASAFDEDDDSKSLMDRIGDASSKLNPSSPEFMRISIPFGEGRRTTISTGGFFRSALAMSGKIYNDPDNALTYAGQFLGTRKSPGVSTAIQLYTQKDFFDRDVTIAETLVQTFLPVALKEPGLQISKDVIEKLPEWTGGRVDGTSLAIDPPPSAMTTMRTMFYSMMGVNAFTESSSGKYRRQVDALSEKTYGKVYHDLTYDEKLEMADQAEEIGIKVERLSGRAANYQSFMISRFKKSFLDTRVTQSLDKLNPNALASVALTMKWGVEEGDLYVRFSSEDSKEMHREFAKKVSSYINSEVRGNEDKLDFKDDASPEISNLWNDTQIEFGYPSN